MSGRPIIPPCARYVRVAGRARAADIVALGICGAMRARKGAPRPVVDLAALMESANRDAAHFDVVLDAYLVDQRSRPADLSFRPSPATAPPVHPAVAARRAVIY